MSVDEGLFAWMQEALEPLGTVTKRAMMGGATLYLDGIVFAIIGSNDGLWFKADSETDAVWDAADCPRFEVEMAGKLATMNYRRAPDEVYDEAEAMQRWAQLALDAGIRASAKRKPKAKLEPQLKSQPPAAEKKARGGV
jgi:DNA transformation protein